MAKSSKRTPSTVAVIGCGPGGMFFLHALETRRKQMEASGDEEGLASLPIVTCFEMASEPGGVWKAKRGESSSSSEGSDKVNPADSTNMYEALWTNGPKEIIEFFDYHFDEHFHQALPVYMPRQPLLEYMLCRVTRNCPHFFDAVRFNTAVTSVTYDDEAEKFTVLSRNHETEEEMTEEFDKCIWAAGENGKPNIPGKISSLLKDGGFKGKAIHSSATEDFETDVKGKRVVFIGDAYSAEDLALQAIKLGVEKIFICSRSGEEVASYTGAWPMNKVEVLESMMPIEVIQNGCGIRMQKHEYDTDTWKYEVLEEGDTRDLLDISTVVYCTGYKTNTDMLEKSLRSPFINCEYPEELPDSWTMKPNPLSEEFGDIPAADELWEPQTFLPELYRCALISNPNMMYMHTMSYSPILEIDVSAWLCLSYITGENELPSEEEMYRRNELQLMDEMNVPGLRYSVDKNYNEAWKQVPDDHWTNNTEDPRTIQIGKETGRSHFRLVARDMRDSGHPSDIGTYEKLNEKGEAMVEMNYSSTAARFLLKPDSEDRDWRTFRDHDPSSNYSVFTGTRAVPLKKRWLELEEEDCGITDTVEAVAPVFPKKSVPSSPSSSSERITNRGGAASSKPSVELDLNEMVVHIPHVVDTDSSSGGS